ncbi:hypothetical protein BU23DRAFT_587406 [Bimuria novae-zelandiae CBS 107.79]|uniref:OsmC-like protein n=1 Tax=Bimuria novae-zelandiae CBS 107.79 TaxID=1447943 RepID=A0A6A5VJA1_9PLEO|nr:hypothetical protein BU23DRAFT_587406 [Bimuria novae-zelandiae CBS 107.79]
MTKRKNSRAWSFLPQKASIISRQFLNTETAPSLYTAYTKVVGARVGHVDDENLKVNLTMAKALGGKRDSAMNAVAAKVGVKMLSKPEDLTVETTAHLVGSMKDLDMGLKVEMLVKVRGLEKEQLEKVVYEARQVCPYSRAIKDNVYTTARCETM